MPLALEIQKTVPHMIAQWADQAEVQTSSGYSIYSSRDECQTFNKIADLKVTSLTKGFGKSRLLTRAMRLGIRDLRKLKSGTTLAIADRKIFRAENDDFKPVFHFRQGFGPLREGWCEDNEGICYLAGYFLNDKRDSPVNLVKSTDDGQSWEIMRSIRQIRHIHCVQYDTFSREIWMGTGDRDSESSISFSQDKGNTWVDLGSGDQQFRTVSFLFTRDYVYWGSDAPTRQNYIHRYIRKSGSIQRLVAVNAPVHYSTLLQNGTMLFATTAEGDSEGKSAAWDNKAHIWASEDGTSWTDIISWEKDLYPYILGLGRVYFAHGQTRDKVYFTTEALRKADDTLFCAKLSSEPEHPA
jgi:hypothetical protein